MNARSILSLVAGRAISTATTFESFARSRIPAGLGGADTPVDPLVGLAVAPRNFQQYNANNTHLHVHVVVAATVSCLPCEFRTHDRCSREDELLPRGEQMIRA